MRRRMPRQARSLHTVDVILTAAAQVLVERGYAKTSTNHVAKIAGVSIGSLYQYFRNKDELILAVVDRHASSILDLLQSTMADYADADLDVAVRQFVKAMVAVHQFAPDVVRDERSFVEDVKQAILESSKGQSSHDERYGYGALDVGALIANLTAT